MKSNNQPSAIAAVLLAGFLLAPAGIRAEDYDSAHRVEPGDIISADMINELFDTIKEARRSITMADLIGTWKGTFYGIGNDPAHVAPGWSTETAPYYVYQTNVTVNFTDMAGDFCEIFTSTPSPFEQEYTGMHTGRASVVQGMLFVVGMQVGIGPYLIDRISADRIRLARSGTGKTYLGVLDRQNVPPRKPKLLSAEAAGTEVALTWQDNSDDEDAFTILRRDKLSGSYSNIETVAANTTCWTNTVSASGFYWYRIAATNSCGLSMGSNVKRVVVP